MEINAPHEESKNTKTENTRKSRKYAYIGEIPIIKHIILTILLRKQQKSPEVTSNYQKSLKYMKVIRTHANSNLMCLEHVKPFINVTEFTTFRLTGNHSNLSNL